MMAGTVTLPGGKKVNKWVAGGIAVGGAAAAYFVWKNHQASSTAAASAGTSSGMVTDPDTGQQYPADGTDPVTGETYGQEIGQYGSVSAADQAVQSTEQSYLTSEGDLYGTGYSTGQYDTGGYGGSTTVSGSVYTSNSAWAQAATAGLTDIGYNGTDVAQALGLYLTGSPVTPAEATIIKAAIAEYEDPPDGTFQIISAPPGNTSSGGKTVAGLHVIKVDAASKGNNGAVQVGWNQASGATSYSVYMEAKGTFTTTKTIANEGGLSPGHHSVMVTPKPGGKGTSVSFTVPKAKGWKA